MAQDNADGSSFTAVLRCCSAAAESQPCSSLSQHRQCHWRPACGHILHPSPQILYPSPSSFTSIPTELPFHSHPYPEKFVSLLQLFHNVLYNPHHVLNQLLPPVKDTIYNLRHRSHSLTLSSEDSNLIRKNFLHRMLYKDIY